MTGSGPFHSFSILPAPLCIRIASPLLSDVSPSPGLHTSPCSCSHISPLFLFLRMHTPFSGLPHHSFSSAFRFQSHISPLSFRSLSIARFLFPRLCSAPVPAPVLRCPAVSPHTLLRSLPLRSGSQNGPLSSAVFLSSRNIPSSRLFCSQHSPCLLSAPSIRHSAYVLISPAFCLFLSVPVCSFFHPDTAPYLPYSAGPVPSRILLHSFPGFPYPLPASSTAARSPDRTRSAPANGYPSSGIPGSRCLTRSARSLPGCTAPALPHISAAYGPLHILLPLLPVPLHSFLPLPLPVPASLPLWPVLLVLPVRLPGLRFPSLRRPVLLLLRFPASFLLVPSCSFSLSFFSYLITQIQYLHILKNIPISLLSALFFWRVSLLYLLSTLMESHLFFFPYFFPSLLIQAHA